MDHLPYPVCQHKHKQVLCRAPIRTYYPEEFFKYPCSNGVNYEDLLETGLPTDFDSDWAEEFLQSWLWFSLLAQVLNQPIDAKYFTQRQGPKSYIHTHYLNSHLEKWAQREYQEFESNKGLMPKQKMRYFRASAALSDARRFVVKHLSCERMGQGYLDGRMSSTIKKLPPPLLLSFAILGKTLQEERPQLFDRVQTTGPFWRDPALEEDSWGYSVYSRHQLLQNGWCPSDVHRLESTLDGVKIMYFSSGLPAPDAANDPKQTIDHTTCTSQQCMNTDKRKHEREYHMPGCIESSCPRLSIDIGDEELIQIINSGFTPLVTFESDGKIHCRPYNLKSDFHFGVVSHTWGDRFIHGVLPDHRDERHIHLCHVIELQRTFDELVQKKEENHGTADHVPFWLDAFCIPTRPSMIGKVLDTTRNIYSKASAVLVWDRALLDMQIPNNPIEANLRIRTSQWAQRLWTFSEAVLAKRIVVKFQDSNIDMETIGAARWIAKRQLYDKYHHVWKAGYPFSTATWRLRKAVQALDSGKDQEEAKYAVQWAWQAVQFRRVTNVADETKVMAQVLGLQATSIAELDDLREAKENVAAKRMARFIDLLDAAEGLGIPSGIIFLPGPSLANSLPQTAGYEWAPKTWLSREAHAYPLFRPLRPAAKMHKRGLLVHFPGLAVLCPPNAPISHKIWVAVHQSLHKWYKIVVEVNDGFDAFWTNKVLPSQQASIIMCTDEPRERWEIGVLVTMEGSASQGQIRVVKVLCRVWMRLETNPDIVKIMQDRVRLDPEGTLFGEQLGKDTEWCITSNEMLGMGNANDLRRLSSA